MRVAIYDRVEPSMPTALPLRSVQTCSHRAATLFLAVMIPALMAVATAALLLILEAVFAPATRAAVSQHPALAVEVLAAIGFSAYLLWLPMRRLLARLALSRTVEIDADSVRVTEGSPFGTWHWVAPLASYAGVAHHVRASLSGTRHELILVHPTREKSVLLGVAPRTSQAEVDAVVALLGSKEIPPSALYRFTAPWTRMPPVAAAPTGSAITDVAHA
jgi:hypothetical protein